MYLLDSDWSPYVSYSESFTPVAGTSRQGSRFKPLRGEQIEEKNQLTVDPSDALNQVQAGQTKNQGVELEWKAALTPTLEALAHYNYTDLDAQITQVPRDQAALWGKWRFAVGDVTGLAVGAGVRCMGDFKDGDAPTTPSIALVDALLSWDTPKWRYALNVNNLTDKVYNAICLSRGDCWYGARRTVIASATYRF